MGTFGFSTEKLKNIEFYLQEKYIDTNRYVGTLTGIYRNGQLGFISTLGLMDRESHKPVERDTIFRIYSMTKPITSVALMSLYEKGLFQLDDPVSEYIPSFKDLKIYEEGILGNYKTHCPDREMTIRDLLSHQSGLTNGSYKRTNVDAAYREQGVGFFDIKGNFKPVHKPQENLEKFVNVLSTIPLEFSPGTA